MRQIEVDEEVWAALQDRAVPLEDDANAVLRRVLGLDVATVSHPVRPQPTDSRVRRGHLLPERDYEIPLLQTLVELGGSAPTGDVLDALEPKLALTPLDREQLSSGGLRWRNRAQFVRHKLVQVGDLADRSPFGVWEITEQGRERVRREAASRRHASTSGR